MANRIFKYELDAVPDQRVLMPTGARLLDAQVQNGILCVWAEVSPQAQPEARRFCLLGTGDEMPEGVIGHVATFQALGVHGEPLVFHLFELRP